MKKLLLLLAALLPLSACTIYEDGYGVHSVSAYTYAESYGYNPCSIGYVPVGAAACYRSGYYAGYPSYYDGYRWHRYFADLHRRDYPSRYRYDDNRRDRPAYRWEDSYSSGHDRNRDYRRGDNRPPQGADRRDQAEPRSTYRWEDSYPSGRADRRDQANRPRPYDWNDSYRSNQRQRNEYREVQRRVERHGGGESRRVERRERRN